MRKRVLSMFIALSTICVASNSALSISALSAEEATDNMVVEETNNVGTIEENVDFSFATKDVDSTDTEKLKDGQYTYVLNDGKAIITEVDDNISGSIVIPSTLGGHPVKEIRPMVFRNCYGLTNVVIPEGITDIGRNAFSGCSNLVSVVIPKDVNQIHMGAFEGCTSLKDITLPKNLTSIGNRAFMNCTSVETIEIPESVQFIDVYAFRDCISLADIILSDNIESIGAGAFTNTKYYNNEQNWENGTLYIGNHLIATNPDYIGEQYAIKAGTKTINEMAFASCNSLRSLIIPISLTHMYYDTFSYFDRLSDVYYEGNEIQWKEIAYNGDDLTATIHFNSTGTNPPRIVDEPEVDFTNDVYTVDVQLQNVEYDSNIIAVTYDNGAATGFDMDTISAGDTEKTFSVNADSVNVVKVFIWDSLNGMRPLCEAKTVKIQ